MEASTAKPLRPKPEVPTAAEIVTLTALAWAVSVVLQVIVNG